MKIQEVTIEGYQSHTNSTATEDIPEIQYDNSKTQSSSCKGKTTTALHVRKGAGTNYASKGVWPKGTSLLLYVLNADLRQLQNST